MEIKINKWLGKIDEPSVHASFQDYLRRNICKHMVFNVILWALLSIGLLWHEREDPLVLIYIANLLLALIAWYCTKRHLWTVEYFSLAFSLSLMISVTIINFSRDCWGEYEGDDLVFRILMVLVFF
jgi:hypothetical protein